MFATGVGVVKVTTFTIMLKFHCRGPQCASNTFQHFLDHFSTLCDRSLKKKNKKFAKKVASNVSFHTILRFTGLSTINFSY